VFQEVILPILQETGVDNRGQVLHCNISIDIIKYGQTTRIQFPGALYHITHRGNERRSIFLDNMDKQTFLEPMSENKQSPGKFKKRIYVRLLFFLPLWAVIFFLPAGTFAYWQAWIYFGILFVPAVVFSVYFLKKDPKLLERRMRMKEKEKEQKLIVKLSYFCSLTFLLPGFDYRFGWSDVPVPLVIAADIVILLSFGIYFLVMRENSYASRIIEVEQDQKVITTGPYALVRHPMYFGVLLMFLSTPLALGSYWAMIPSLLIIPILVARILNEEKVLVRDLDGYREYRQKVKYRLIPGLW
jgi:protein-S-isoprenylcysteine O-methyltransferase Ste14